MAPLSLLGTVVRDKMMKTVTVQVIARFLVSSFAGVLHADSLVLTFSFGIID
jgi:ribosomal protein S17